MFSPGETPLIILSEGCFGTQQSKTATGVLRYGNWPVVAVIDSTCAGKRVREVTDIPLDVPVVANFGQALALGEPKALLLGTAPVGGRLPQEWRATIRQALERGIHIINGLHVFLNDDPEFRQLAGASGARLWDMRNPDQYAHLADNPVALQEPRPPNVTVVTMVGSDCSVGKMCTALELERYARERGQKSAFVATGQTGIMITGDGVPLDRVAGDFMAGGVERCMMAAIERHQPDWVFVEGQGSLLHPGFSSVTLGLLHGSNPDAMILCHRSDLKQIRGGYDITIPSFNRLIEIYEAAAAWPASSHNPAAKVVGIALNTAAFAESEARALIHQAESETGLPVSDPVRYGVAPLFDGLVGFRKNRPQALESPGL